jgi:hypothetical protein
MQKEEGGREGGRRRERGGRRKRREERKEGVLDHRHVPSISVKWKGDDGKHFIFHIALYTQ